MRSCLCAAVLLACAPLLSAADRPNVIVILADDSGWGDYSIHGNTNLATPNLDSIAKSGALFDRFYVCAVCSPTRAEFLTGRYHPRGGVYATSTGGERLNTDEVTIGQTFKAAGYATAAFGKWHNGTQGPYHPNARGFDEYYGFTSGHWGNYFDPMLDHNGRLVTGKGFIIDDLTDHAMSFIESKKDQPFFVYVPFNTPHTPAQVPDKFYDKFANDPIAMRAPTTHPKQPRKPGKDGKDGKAARPDTEDLAKTRAALAMVENIDWNVGRILQKLDQLKLADNTIVLYFSDNGPNSARWNGDMRGRKGSTDEGGVRSAMFIRWPGRIAPGTRVTQIAGAIDLLPTLADMAGVPVISQKPLDGMSVKPLLLPQAGTEAPRSPGFPADRMIFSHWGGRVSVRTQQHRLDHNGKLYDMVADGSQTIDIADKQPALAAKLRDAVAKWSAEVLPGIARDDRPLPIGYKPMPMTQLPARDGVAHGSVQRSAGAPNCSFFTNFKSTADSITWDVQVLTPGRYEAVVYYTCPKADVGSTVELSLGPAKVTTKITQPHDPPLYGMEHDRASRGSESYVKDFKPMKLGVLDLTSGGTVRGPLTLRALDVPGNQVMDVRLILLTLLP